MKKNLAFKLNYNDGGSDEQHFGFRDTCSNEIIEWNIKQKHSWCTNERCQCVQFYEDNFEGFPPELPCYESEVLDYWYADAGISYTKQGEIPRNIVNTEKGKYVVLTTRLPGKKESERLVIGIFQIGIIETVLGKSTKIYEFPGQHIELFKNEEIFFWDYYFNPNNPRRMVWGTGLYRYLTNEQVLLIMKDIVSIKRDSGEKAKARKLMNHFARNVELDVKKLGLPTGARRCVQLSFTGY